MHTWKWQSLSKPVLFRTVSHKISIYLSFCHLFILGLLFLFTFYSKLYFILIIGVLKIMHWCIWKHLNWKQSRLYKHWRGLFSLSAQVTTYLREYVSCNSASYVSRCHIYRTKSLIRFCMTHQFWFLETTKTLCRRHFQNFNFLFQTRVQEWHFDMPFKA